MMGLGLFALIVWYLVRKFGAKKLEDDGSDDCSPDKITTEGSDLRSLRKAAQASGSGAPPTKVVVIAGSEEEPKIEVQVEERGTGSPRQSGLPAEPAGPPPEHDSEAASERPVEVDQCTADEEDVERGAEAAPSWSSPPTVKEGGEEDPLAPPAEPEADVQDQQGVDSKLDADQVKAGIFMQLHKTMREDLVSRKKRYKTLCLQWHPDKNQHDKERTTEVFKFLQEQRAMYLWE
eukprot:CAMPEP_0171073000 /NCGR_PEP_ID=MMETSP0766_2-20121228/11225_1 /TAXON_ID=439317 /ORGANISM="Gambierdiscus australes, Strain CAWD 149" /LENGTH=233 /DNA_ID=CAMNT_0011529647 /DNA_START=25 /DNA_END=725 /DNA_ORIENTATION=+